MATIFPPRVPKAGALVDASSIDPIREAHFRELREQHQRNRAIPYKQRKANARELRKRNINSQHEFVEANKDKIPEKKDSQEKYSKDRPHPQERHELQQVAQELNHTVSTEGSDLPIPPRMPWKKHIARQSKIVQTTIALRKFAKVTNAQAQRILDITPGVHLAGTSTIDFGIHDSVPLADSTLVDDSVESTLAGTTSSSIDHGADNCISSSDGGVAATIEEIDRSGASSPTLNAYEDGSHYPSYGHDEAILTPIPANSFRVPSSVAGPTNLNTDEDSVMTPFNNVHNNSIHGTSLVPVGVHDGADQKSSDLVDIGVAVTTPPSYTSTLHKHLLPLRTDRLSVSGAISHPTGYAPYTPSPPTLVPSPLDKELPPKPILRPEESPERRGLFDATDSALKKLDSSHPPLRPAPSTGDFGDSPTVTDGFKRASSLISSPSSTSSAMFGTAVAVPVAGTATGTDLRLHRPPISKSKVSASVYVSKDGSPMQYERKLVPPSELGKTKQVSPLGKSEVVSSNSTPTTGNGKPSEKGKVKHRAVSNDLNTKKMTADGDFSRRMKYGIGATIRYSSDAHETIMGVPPKDINTTSRPPRTSSLPVPTPRSISHQLPNRPKPSGPGSPSSPVAGDTRSTSEGSSFDHKGSKSASQVSFAARLSRPTAASTARAAASQDNMLQRGRSSFGGRKSTMSLNSAPKSAGAPINKNPSVSAGSLSLPKNSNNQSSADEEVLMPKSKTIISFKRASNGIKSRFSTMIAGRRRHTDVYPNMGSFTAPSQEQSNPSEDSVVTTRTDGSRVQSTNLHRNNRTSSAPRVLSAQRAESSAAGASEFSLAEQVSESGGAGTGGGLVVTEAVRDNHLEEQLHEATAVLNSVVRAAQGEGGTSDETLEEVRELVSALGEAIVAARSAHMAEIRVRTWIDKLTTEIVRKAGEAAAEVAASRFV